MDGGRLLTRVAAIQAATNVLLGDAYCAGAAHVGFRVGGRLQSGRSSYVRLDSTLNGVDPLEVTPHVVEMSLFAKVKDRLEIAFPANHPTQTLV